MTSSQDQDRMVSHRCHKCIWWDNQHPSVALIPIELCKENPGFCRRRRSGTLLIGQHLYGVHPVMDADEFCGEFKGSS